jgi:uncharacterized protein YukE
MTQLFNVVQEEALSPIQKMLDEVSGGTIWRGTGANAFIQEVSEIFIPGVGSISQHISRTSSNVLSAQQRIEQADAEVRQLVGSRLDDVFDFFR